jgi:GDPmannose 4,6-dehydratase
VSLADIHHASWEGKGEQEIGIDDKTGKVIVRVDTKYFRPAEVE